jgi:fibronectin type 3 domain-containing protein
MGRFDAAARQARDTAVTAGRRYAYRLVAVDSAGNRSAPAADSVAFSDFTPPAAPRRVTVQRLEAGVVVTWERVASPDLAGYRVYRSHLPTGVFELLTPAPVPGLTWTDPHPPADAFYQVRAVDRAGNESAPSPVAHAGGGPR